MNKSLRLKLSMMLMIIVLGIVVCSNLISGLFLGDYYLYGKQKSLIETYNDINHIYTLSNPLLSGGDSEESGSSQFASVLSEDFQNSLERISEGRSISIVIFRAGMKINLFNLTKRPEYIPIYSSMGNQSVSDDNQQEQSKMLEDFIYPKNNYTVIKDTEQYLLAKMFVQRLGNDFLYLSARLDNGDYILLRASIDSIENSVNLSNRFSMYISLIMLVAGAIIVYIISRNFTQPILDLAQIAAHMSELDFTTKYEIARQDEIGVLGNSMNYLSTTLETTLGELKLANARLQKDLERKTQIDNMRTEFLSNVSHELKTPIALIQGYAEGLVENINDDEESRNFYCEVIVDEASKMNNIVKKLLSLNQLEFGENNINMEHFDIVGVIKNMLSASDILFKQKEVTLEFESEDEIYVWADVYMVEEVFNNYLSNAFNHVDDEKLIRVRIEKKEQQVRVSVFNTGHPIPEEDIGKIWGKFYKVDKARTREYGGSGVGLSIVKATMDLLGQSYGVENKENGVEFWFELDATNGIPAIREDA